MEREQHLAQVQATVSEYKRVRTVLDSISYQLTQGRTAVYLTVGADGQVDPAQRARLLAHTLASPVTSPLFETIRQMDQLITDLEEYGSRL